MYSVSSMSSGSQRRSSANSDAVFISNFASMAGELSVDSLGIYSASKFAVEGLSEAIKVELAPYGIDVMIVEPGPFDTEWLGKNAIWAPRDVARYPNVWNYVDAMKGVYADRRQVGDPARAAEAILDTVALAPVPSRLPGYSAASGVLVQAWIVSRRDWRSHWISYPC
jgi:NAD(P)-dependent dehydrogenase (short-subunit alcohol dehydrogenase family)